MTSIGSTVKSKRKARGLSQTELGSAAGVSLNVIRSIESDKDTVTVQNLKKVLFLFGLELTIKDRSS